MEGTAVRTYDKDALRKIRRRAGLTQVALATCSGVPLDTIRDYEQGRSTPSVDRLFILADTLGCSTEDFAINEGNACSQKTTARS
jgi:transcriptional regulator with XRE-family HTH domain